MKNERFEFKRTMFAKLFGVIAPLSSLYFLSDRGTIYNTIILDDDDNDEKDDENHDGYYCFGCNRCVLH